MIVNHPVFDAHFHIGPYGTQSFADYTITPIETQYDHFTGDDCAAYLRHHQITAGVIVPTYLEDQTVAFNYNDLVMQAVQKHPNLYGGLWVSPLPEVEALNETTLSTLPQPKIRALKIASNTWAPFSIDPSSWTKQVRRQVELILETAAKHNLIIHFHTGYLPGADPLDFAAFLAEYGTAATYQLVHMGEAIGPALRFVPRFIDWLKQGYDLYTDTSIVPGFGPAWLISQLQQHDIGLDRVFFATDSPWGRFPTEYWKIAGLEIDDDLKHRLFWQNAARLYRAESMTA